MQVTLESSHGLERVLSIELPASDITSRFDGKVAKLASEAQLPGFRKGKVPPKVIKDRYGASVLGEIVNELIQSSLPKALAEQQLQPAGLPSVDADTPRVGEDFVYKVKFEIFPEFTLNGLADQTVEKTVSDIKDTDLDAMLARLQKQKAVYKPITRSAQAGDQVDIDFKGTVDGEEFAGNSAEHYHLNLGSGSMIPGFEDQIIGMKAGEDKDINVKFPEEYQAKELAGRDAVFKIHCHEVQEEVLPTIDDEFAQLFDVKEGGIDKFRKDIKESMTRELESRMTEINKQAVFEALLQANQIDIPTSLIDEEIKRLQEEMMQRLTGGQEVDSSKFPELPRDMFETRARKRVAVGLLLREYINTHNIEVDKSRVQRYLEVMARAYDKPDEMIAWYNQSKDRLGQIEAKVLEDQVVEQLLNEAKIVDKSLTYDEVMAYVPPEA